jgi:hypothetical protein
MTSGPHLVAVEAQLGRRWAGSQAGQTAAGGKMVGEEENEGRGQTLVEWVQTKNRPDKRERVFYCEKQPNQMNSNTNLNSSTQKQCTSMYATINSYISLFN